MSEWQSRLKQEYRIRALELIETCWALLHGVGDEARDQDLRARLLKNGRPYGPRCRDWISGGTRRRCCRRRRPLTTCVFLLGGEARSTTGRDFASQRVTDHWRGVAIITIPAVKETWC